MKHHTKIISVFSIFIYWAALFSDESPTFNEKLSEADALMDSHLYDQALLIYRAIEQEHPKLNGSFELALRKSQALYAAGNYEEASTLLNEILQKTPEGFEPEASFLLAKTYVRLKNDTLAIASLEGYFLHPLANLSHLYEGSMELGLSYFHLGKYPEAERYFLAVKKENKPTPYYLLSQLYLGKIALQNKKPRQALEIFSELEKQMESSTDLAKELSDYKKTAQFQLDNYAEAVSLFQAATEEYNQKNYSEAEKIFLELTEEYPRSPFAGDAWFWAACCADKLKRDILIGKHRRKIAFEQYPSSFYAPEAYFTYYTQQEYLQGDRMAIKHLQTFADRHPNTPFLIETYYLIGLDYKRDRKTPEGKWLRKKNLTEAIDAFQTAETLFDKLAIENKISPEKLEYYFSVRYRANLERALANLNIASESQGAKKHIYLEYAEEVFKSLVSDFNESHNIYIEKLLSQNLFPPFYEEVLFGLAQTFSKQGKESEAKIILNKMLHLYEQNGTTKTYYLSRTWDEMGRIFLKQREYKEALQCFNQAEEIGKSNHLLSTDQRLDLLIQQSYCYRALSQYEKAILILSNVVNDQAISSLRMKAMYLRAEVYEELNRPELAKKQLESMVKKGGIWSQKAQEKLDKDYRR